MSDFYDGYALGLFMGWASMIITALLVYVIKQNKINKLEQENHDLKKAIEDYELW